MTEALLESALLPSVDMKEHLFCLELLHLLMIGRLGTCNISCIKYEGTIQAWKQKVLKNKYWDEGLNNYVVQCEDGTIENP